MNASGMTTAFIGNHTEWDVSTSSLTRYYYAGATRVAMRKNNTVYYLLGDHLGSTSLTTDENGQNPVKQLYLPWGEVRYTDGTLQTKYTYTGQYSNLTDFGLMYYNARWYDSLLGRFSSADTLVPQPGSPVSYDRYSYVNNNPIRNIDPSGHRACSGMDENGTCVVDEDWRIKENPIRHPNPLSTNPHHPIKTVQASFQMLPVFDPYYYRESAEETYTDYSGSGDNNGYVASQVAMIGIANDLLLGYRPTFYKKFTPYDQIVTIYYEETYQGVPRLDALKTTTVTDITITNKSSLNRVVNYSINLLTDESLLVESTHAVTGQTVSLKMSSIILHSNSLNLSVTAFTGCIGACVWDPKNIIFRGSTNFIFDP